MSKITEFARGKPCQIRIPGTCNFDPATSVWCHGNGSAAGKGIGQKSFDLLGAIGCSACHDVVDGRVPSKVFDRNEIRLMFADGHARSLRLLIDAGLVKF